MNLASGSAIMGGTSYLGGLAVAASGPSAGLSLALFAFVMAAYGVYNYFIQPKLVDVMGEYGIWGMSEQIPEYGTSPDDRTDWEVGIDKIKEDWGIFEDEKDFEISYVQQRIDFVDTNPWWQDTLWIEEQEPKIGDDNPHIDVEVPIINVVYDEEEAIENWISVYLDTHNHNTYFLENLPNVEKSAYDYRISQVIDWWDVEGFEEDYQEVLTKWSLWLVETFAPNSKYVKYQDFTGAVASTQYDYFWRSEGDSLLGDPNHEDQFTLLEDQFSSTEFKYYKSAGFAMDPSGRPMLVPVAQNNRNLSDPIQRELDFMEMMLLSVYWDEFQACRSYDPRILAINLGLQMIQVGVSVCAGNLGSLFANPSQYLGHYAGSWGKWVLDLGSEMVQEIMIENIISTVALELGASTGLAEMLGESISGGLESVISVNKIFGDSDSKPRMPSTIEVMSGHTTQTSSQYIDSRSQIRNVEHSSLAKLINTLKTKLMGSSVFGSLTNLRNQPLMISALNQIMNERMDSNIDQNRVVKNLDNMQITKFPALIMADINFKSDVKNALWDTIIAGGTVQDFLNNVIFQDAWGLLDENGDQVREMYFEVVKKGHGTVYYKQDGSVYEKISGEFVRMNEYGPKTLAELFSDADTINLIDPEKTQPLYWRSLSNPEKFLTDFNKLVESVSDHPHNLNYEIHNTVTKLMELGLNIKAPRDTIRTKKIVQRLIKGAEKLSKYYSFKSMDNKVLSDVYDYANELCQGIRELRKGNYENMGSGFSQELTDGISADFYMASYYRAMFYYFREISSFSLKYTSPLSASKFGKQIYSKIRFDIMTTMLKQKFANSQFRSVRKRINGIINSEMSAFRLEIASYLNKEKGRITVRTFDAFVESLHLELSIASRIESEDFGFNKKALAKEFMKGRVYEIKCLKWDLNNMESKITDFTRMHSEVITEEFDLDSNFLRHYAVLVNKIQDNSKMHVVQFEIYEPTIKGTLRFEIRCDSAAEAELIVSTLKALDRGMNDGGFIKHMFADKVFKNLVNIDDITLVANSYAWKIKMGGNSYRFYEISDFNKLPDFADATISQIGKEYFLTKDGITYPVEWAPFETSLDLGLIFRNENDGLGIIVEKLGYRRLEQAEIRLYGLLKDAQCKDDIDTGMAQIYVSRPQCDSYYRNTGREGDIIENIGRIAPLLKQSEYDLLMRCIGFVSFKTLDPSQLPLFEEIIRDLSLHPEKYGFSISMREELIKIQEAFGFSVNHDTGQIISDYTSTDMAQWWINFYASRNEGNIMQNIYNKYLTLLAEGKFYIAPSLQISLGSFL